MAKGAYVQNEWIEYGFTLSAEGGVGTLPRVFDTANPGGETPEACGDSDLGAPNKACPGGGPGRGIGGIPGQPGENCEPLGNALIVQEPGESCPDDNVNGGIINIVFPATNGQYVYELGLLDIDYEAVVEVGYETLTGFKQRNIPVPLLGDNSYQVLAINQANVKWIKVKIERSGAITSIKLCPEESVTPPPSGTQPTTSPLVPTARPPSLRPPSVSPPTSGTTPTKPGSAPTPAPGNCNLVTVGFDKDANGVAVTKGQYVQDEWLPYGMTLFAEGGVGSVPRIFDTASPGTSKEGDLDLGAPNKACPGGGPGHGEGGEPGQPGMNCSPKGNALIIQEPGTSVPDDNVDGGIITLDYPFPNGTYVKNIGLLDVDYGANIVVVYETASGSKEYTIAVPLLGDNAAQTVEIDQANVKWIKVVLERSGGVTDVTFCSL